MEDPTPPQSFSTGRKLGAGALVAIAALALVAIVAMSNFIAMRHYRKFAWGSEGESRLSGVTRQVLKSLTNTVHVTVYYDPHEAMYSQIVAMLKEYADLSPKIAVDYLNPDADPNRAADIKKKYNLKDGARELVIFECGGRIAMVGQGMLSELDVSKLVKGISNEVKRKAFLGERYFTSKIMEVAEGRRFRVYFTYQHGEHDPEDADQADGYRKFVDIVRDLTAVPAALKLTDTNEVPSDCDLLVIAGPRLRFSEMEAAKIDKYLRERGGRLFLLLRSGVNTGLEKMLGGWGVETADDAVIDPPNALQGIASLLQVVNTGSHQTVRKIDKHDPLELVRPRSLEIRKGTVSQGTDAPQVTELLKTSEAGISIANFSERKSLEPAAGDRQGVITLAVAVVKGENQGVKLSATRMIVTGDSNFLDNKFLPAGMNYQFAWDSINWLLDRSTLMEIAPQRFSEFHFQMTRSQSRAVTLIVMLVVPGSILVVGLLVWLRRRI